MRRLIIFSFIVTLVVATQHQDFDPKSQDNATGQQKLAEDDSTVPVKSTLKRKPRVSRMASESSLNSNKDVWQSPPVEEAFMRGFDAGYLHRSVYEGKLMDASRTTVAYPMQPYNQQPLTDIGLTTSGKPNKSGFQINFQPDHSASPDLSQFSLLQPVPHKPYQSQPNGQLNYVLNSPYQAPPNIQPNPNPNIPYQNPTNTQPQLNLNPQYQVPNGPPPLNMNAPYQAQTNGQLGLNANSLYQAPNGQPNTNRDQKTNRPQPPPYNPAYPPVNNGNPSYSTYQTPNPTQSQRPQVQPNGFW